MQPRAVHKDAPLDGAKGALRRRLGTMADAPWRSACIGNVPACDATAIAMYASYSGSSTTPR